MKKYRKIIWMLCAATSIVAMGGCTTKNNSETTAEQGDEVTTQKEEERSDTQETSELEESSDTLEAGESIDESDTLEESKTEETSSPERRKKMERNNETSTLFQELTKYNFIFCSGAGAWMTVLNIDADGSFYGSYHDSDMGVTGDGYPNGSEYNCDFFGAFTEPVKINDYTYSVKIASMDYEKEVGTEEIIDGVKHYYTEPYGLENATDIYIYLPGTPTSALSEEFCSWVSYVNIDEATGTMNSYGICNVAEQEGFYSELKEGEIPAADGTETTVSIDDELADVENQAAEAQRKLDQASTQTEANEASSELYNIWDAELNRIWGLLKEGLDETTMNQLTTEEKDWVSKKEQQMKDAGAIYEDGTMQSMVENQKGAELTRTRVYELADYLR